MKRSWKEKVDEWIKVYKKPVYYKTADQLPEKTYLKISKLGAKLKKEYEADGPLNDVAKTNICNDVRHIINKNRNKRVVGIGAIMQVLHWL